MESSVKFSITIPVYNNFEGLILSLDSLVNQTYKNFEVVVVDDGSGLDTDLIKTIYNDLNITIYSFKENKGRPIARQKSFDLSKGEYIAFLDAGDTYDENYLLDAFKAIDKWNVGIVSQSMTVKYKDLVRYSNCINKIVQLDSNFDTSAISFAATVIKASFVNGYSFDSRLKYSQDNHLLSYIKNNVVTKIALLNTHSYKYEQGERMDYSTTYNKFKYSSYRLWLERRYTKSFVAILKLILFTIVHMSLGYEFIFKKRYKNKYQ